MSGCENVVQLSIHVIVLSSLGGGLISALIIKTAEHFSQKHNTSYKIAYSWLYEKRAEVNKKIFSSLLMVTEELRHVISIGKLREGKHHELWKSENNFASSKAEFNENSIYFPKEVRKELNKIWDILDCWINNIRKLIDKNGNLDCGEIDLKKFNSETDNALHALQDYFYEMVKC